MEANITSGVHLTPTYGELVDDPSMPMDQIYPALLESFGIILLGYLAGKYVVYIFLNTNTDWTHYLFYYIF